MEANKKPKGKETKKKPAEEEHEHPSAKHVSEGHSTDAKGTATTTHEASERSATTDSSREPKNPHDDMPTGGNIR